MTAAPGLPPMLVVVLSFNGRHDTLDCLDSLAPQAQGVADLLVVDNGSTDGSADAIRGAHPSVTLMELGRNLGFAGGNNAGIRHALDSGYRSVLLLNNDTVLPPGALAALARCAGRLGPCLLHPMVISGQDRARPHLDPTAGLDLPQRAEQVPAHPGVFELNFAYGACLLIDTAIFRRVGLLDERLFLQMEETDLFRRARDAGFRAFCTTDTRIVHKESPSFGGTRAPLKTYYGTRNTLLLAERFGMRGWLAELRSLYWSLEHLAATTGGRVAGPGSFLLWLAGRSRFAAAIRAALRDYALRRFGAAGPATVARLRSAPSRGAARRPGTAALPETRGA